MIKEYQNWKRELAVLESQLSNYKGEALSDVIEILCFSRPDGERVQTSTIADTTASTVFAYPKLAQQMSDEVAAHLLMRYQEIAEEVSFLEHIIENLPSRLSAVMHDLIFGRLSWKEVETKYHVSETMIAKYRRQALKDIEKAYVFRDKHTETYILS